MTSSKLKITIIAVSLILMITSADVSQVLANDQNAEYPENIRKIRIEDFQKYDQVMQVLSGEKDKVREKVKDKLTFEKFYSSDEIKTRDASEFVKNYSLEGKSVLEIKEFETRVIKPYKEMEPKTKLKYKEVFVPGLLSYQVHSINSTSSGKIFLDSQAMNYTLNAQSVIDSLVDGYEGKLSRGGHFNLVVFVSDYKSRSIEKLQTNKVWRKVYSLLQNWAIETSDYYAFLINEYATPSNIMSLLAEAELNSAIKSISLTVVAHGVNSVYGHGILVHRDDNPKKLGVMDGTFFRDALQKTRVKQITKLVNTNIHACFILDEYEEYGGDSVLGFFESMNPGQVLTGYRGLTYLNTRFVLSLENLLAAGTYKLPRVITKEPVEVTYNGTETLGYATMKTIRGFNLNINKNRDLPREYKEGFNGDDTLYVNDINVSPGPDQSTSVYTDYSVYEHLNVVPPSFFPVAGAQYSFENHREGTWDEFYAQNDDLWFYFAKGNYRGFTEEFSSIDGNHWTGTATSTSNGYLVLNGKYIEEISKAISGRQNEFKLSLLFKYNNLPSTDFDILILGNKSSSLTYQGYSPQFGIKISSNGAIGSVTTASIYTKTGTTLNLADSFDLYVGRPYTLTLTFQSGAWFGTLTSQEDQAMNVFFEGTGFVNIIKPRLYMSSSAAEILVDRAEMMPIVDTFAKVPTLSPVFDDQDLSTLKVEGNGNTQTIQTNDAPSGRFAIKASTIAGEYFSTPSYTIDNYFRYMVFAVQIPSGTTNAVIKIGGTASSTGSAMTITVAPSIHESSSLVFKTDGKWHFYVVDLYRFAGKSSFVMNKMSFYSSSSGTYFDAIYLTSSIQEAATFARGTISISSGRMEDFLPIGTEHLPLMTSYFMKGMDIFGTNTATASNAAVQAYDSFNDGSLSGWTYETNSPYLLLNENGGELKGSAISGSSTYTDRIARAIVQGSVDFEITMAYRLKGNGKFTFMLKSSSGTPIAAIVILDNSNPIFKMVFYNNQGTVVQSYQSPALYDSMDNIRFQIAYSNGQTALSIFSKDYVERKSASTSSLTAGKVALEFTFYTGSPASDYFKLQNYAEKGIKQGFYDNFNDNSMSSAWTYAKTSSTIHFAEQNSRLEAVQSSGGSGWQKTELKANTLAQGTRTISVKLSYYFPKMGALYFRIYDSSNKPIALVGVRDAWASSTSYFMMYFYNADGSLNSNSFSTSAGSLPASGTLYVSIAYSGSQITVSTSGVYSKTLSYSITGRTIKSLSVEAIRHATYWSSASYWRVDDVAEKISITGKDNSYAAEETTYLFSGASSLVPRISANYMTPAKSMSVAFWVYPQSNTGTLVSFGNAASVSYSANTITVVENGKSTVFDASAFSLNQWHHLVIKKVGSDYFVYLDSNILQRTSSQITSSQLSFQEITLGGSSFTGAIENVALFNRSIGIDEIKWLYSNRHLTSAVSFENNLVDNVNPSHTITTTTLKGYGSGIDGMAASFEKSTIDVNYKFVKGTSLNFWVNIRDLEYYGTYYRMAGIAHGPNTYWDQVISFKELSGTMKLTLQDDSGNYRSIDLGKTFEKDFKDKWVMTTIVFDKSSIIVYINGKQVGSTSAFPNSLTITKFGQGYGGRYLNGSLDELQTYDIALGQSEITYLYSLMPRIPNDMVVSKEIKPSDEPTFIVNTDIYNGENGNPKSAEFYMQTTSGSKFGVKLVNDVWYSMAGVQISEFQGYNINTSYTITFTIKTIQTLTGITQQKLVISMSQGNANKTVYNINLPANLIARPEVHYQNGYAIDVSISGYANLGSALYDPSAAWGTYTQGAFALKFDRTTYLATADITPVAQVYSNNLLGLIDDIYDYLTCGYINPTQQQCNIVQDSIFVGNIFSTSSTTITSYNGGSLGGTTITIPSFPDQFQSNYGVNLMAPSIKWTDRWVAQLFQYSNNRKAEINAYHNPNDGKYYFYYNKPLSSLPVNLDIQTDGQTIKIIRMNQYGNILNTYQTSVDASYTISVTPGSTEFFYVQFEHDKGDSRYAISFTPTEKYYSRAYLMGDGSTNKFVTGYTGMPLPNAEPITKSLVTYVKYRWDENGNPVEPIYEELPEYGGKYYLNKIVSMGQLPQENGKLPTTFVTAQTYAQPEALPGAAGIKLVNGTKYWDTINGVNANEYNYQVVSTSNTNFKFNKNTGYMVSLSFKPRKLTTMFLTISSTTAINIAMYSSYDTTIPYSYAYYSLQGIYQYKFTLKLGASINSYVIKLNTNSYDAFVSFSISDTSVDAGYYSKDTKGAEIFVRSQMSGSNILNIVRGSGFNPSTLKLEIQEAQVPPSARQAMQTASQTNPTENRVFDVDLFLEAIVKKFDDFRVLIKNWIYAHLTYTFLGFERTEIADKAWQLLDQYGFSAVGNLINWFGTDQRKELLAKIVLKDQSLQQELNLNTPDNPGYDPAKPMNYLAVAKVGILVFADWLHKSFVAPNTALNAVWKAGMQTLGRSASDTLADVVNDIFGFAGSVMQTMKNAMQQAWDGIRSGATFILKNVFRNMLSTISFVVNSAMKGFASLIATLDPSIAVDLSGAIVNINGIKLGMEFSNDALTFYLGRAISLVDLFGSPTVETLGMPSLVRNMVNLALMSYFIQAGSIGQIISMYIESPAPVTETMKLMIPLLVLYGLFDWLLVAPDQYAAFPLEPINRTRTMGLTAEFFAALHFGWALQLLVNAIAFLVGEVLNAIFGVDKMTLMLGATLIILNVFGDTLKSPLYLSLFDAIVSNPYPNDFYSYTKDALNGHPYSLSPLRLGIAFGEIEGLFSNMFEIKGETLEKLIGFGLYAFLKLFFATGRSQTNPANGLLGGTLLLVLLSFAYHLAMSVLYLKRADRFL